MKATKKAFARHALCLGALFSMAGSANATAMSVPGQRIHDLSTGWGAEGYYIATVGSPPPGADCGGGNIYFLENTAAMRDEMIALLMMAMANQQRVDLRVDGCMSGSMKLKAVRTVK